MIGSVASSRVRFLASAAAAALMASMLAGCKTTGTVDRSAGLSSSNASMRTEADWRREGDEVLRLRATGDFIAGMTDRFAVARHEELVGPVDLPDRF